MRNTFEVTESIGIGRPLAEVYAFTSDDRNDVRWRGGVVSLDVDPPGRVVVGAETTEVMRRHADP